MEPSAQERAFGAEVKRYQATARVSQDWVAKQVGLSRPKVSEICAGRYLPGRQALDALITTLAMDPARAVDLWRQAADSRAERRRAEKIAEHPAPDGWTALPVLPAEVRSLLHAQIQAAHKLPYRLPGARRPSLATVYVRQDLGGATEEPVQDRPRPQPMLDGRAYLMFPTAPPVRQTVRPPAHAVRQALDEHDHLVVTGGPGQGKSTLSLRLAADIATAWTEPTDNADAPLAEPVVPLRLTARELADRTDLPFTHALAESIKAEYGALLAMELTAPLLAERVAGCRWLLLVDGLDEIADLARRDRLVHVLAAWATGTGGRSPYRVVLTTRPIKGATLGPMQRAAAVRYELQPFDDEALRRFAHNWFDEDGSDTADRFVRQIRAAHLDELVRVPLLATIAAIIFEQQHDRPLPDNQYQLYEAYLGLLRSARADHTDLFERLGTALLEHLGEVRLETDGSLLTAAHDWVTARVAPERLQPAWLDELTSFLTAVGPLVVRSGDLQFLHHTFAEHLAATAAARRLVTPFDPQDADFRTLLHAAREDERGRHARSVLVHYTRLHPAEADSLVRWLHSGTSDEQLIAAQLLAWHVPAGAELVDAFLRTARAWAATTQYSATKILKHAVRITHHPGLASWLLDLMRDTTAPWSSRIAAASALATRLRGAETAEAIVLLGTAIEDASVPIPDRLVAGESLTELGPVESAAADHGLRSLLVDPSVNPISRRGAAVALASLGEEPRAHTVRLLLARLDDPASTAKDLIESATALTEIGTEYHNRCADVLLDVLHRSICPIGWRTNAALALATLSPEHAANAVATLTHCAADRRLDYSVRFDAARTLVRLGPQAQSLATRCLRDMLVEPTMTNDDRWQCVSVLGELGAEYRTEASAQLRKVITAPDTNTNATLWAASELTGLGPDFHAEAAEHLLRLAGDPLAEGFEQASALSTLAGLGEPYRAAAIDRLRDTLVDCDATPNDRSTAGSELVRLGTEFHAEVGAVLFEIVAEPHDFSDVLPICRVLVRLDARFRGQAVEDARRSLDPRGGADRCGGVPG